MMTRVVIEIVLAVAAIACSAPIWMVFKKQLFHSRLLANRESLFQLLVAMNAERSFEERTEEMDPPQGNHQLLAELFQFATFKADKTIYSWCAIILLNVTVISLYIGYQYAIINIALIALTAVFPIGHSGRNNAYSSVIEISNVFYRWQDVDCDASMDWAVLNGYGQMWWAMYDLKYTSELANEHAGSIDLSPEEMLEELARSRRGRNQE